MTQLLSLEEMAKHLDDNPNYHVLRAVPKPFANMPLSGELPNGRCIAIVDVETTGLLITEHQLIELSIMLLWVDDLGVVIGHQSPISWLQDPGIALEPNIRLLTGLANDDLRGQKIDDVKASDMLDCADLIIAHNARFDLAWIEQRYPAHRGKAWACSYSEINWLQLKYEGRSQQHLLMQHGWFTEAHRAEADVWSLFWLLQESQTKQGDNLPTTHLQRLLQTADDPSVFIRSSNGSYQAKDRLKARGYRWNPDKKIWYKEIHMDNFLSEKAWFTEQGIPPFDSIEINAHQRHRL